MTAITLRRIEPNRNMRRFYRLDVQPDLFGAACLVREWGRIGRAGRLIQRAYPVRTATEAGAAAENIAMR
jgi:predicted DNA-binding WGR domain protein